MSSSFQRRSLKKRQLLRRGVTRRVNEFAYLCRHRPERVNIIAEGDSWFAYPRKYLLLGPDINLLHHLETKLAGSNSANLLIRASNGDEAVAMTSGSQKYSLARLLEKQGAHIDLILFSGGGNDVVGRYDMDRLLKPYQRGYSAKDCIDLAALKRKMQRIDLAYQELLGLRNAYAPQAVVVAHSYDVVRPSSKGAELLAFYKTGPWILPFLQLKNIPQKLHEPISRLILGRLEQQLNSVARSPLAADKFFVANTQGTLRPGHGQDWLNEIHPTSSGFKRLFRKFYVTMRQSFPQLPA